MPPPQRRWISMKREDVNKLRVVMGAQSFMDRELRAELEDCSDIETAVGRCTDLNHTSLAAAIRRAFGLDKEVGGWGTVTYHVVITDEEAHLLHAMKGAMDAKDELNPAPFYDEMRDICKNHEPALESILRKMIT